MTTRYPWPVLASPPSVRLEDVRLDAEALPPGHVDVEHQRVRADGGRPWERFSCRVVVDHEALPKGLEEPVTYVLATARATASRVPFVLTGGPSEGTVDLLREELTNEASLVVEVAAPYRGRYRVVGRSTPWTVVVEAGTAPIAPGVPPFDMTWVDFDADDAPVIARKALGAAAVMDVSTGSNPRLLLNDGLTGLRNLLHADSARLERRRLRDLIGSDVARLAVSTLFRSAVAEVDVAADGTVIEPTDALQRRVCEAVADAMVDIGDVDELYERLADDESRRLADLWARIDLAVDELTGRRNAVSTACEEIRVV